MQLHFCYYKVELDTARTEPRPSKRPKRRAFPLSWKVQFESWMRYNEGLNLMVCTLCEKHDKRSPWVTGTDNFRMKTVNKHLNSSEHKEAMATEAPGQQALPATFTAARLRRNKAILAAFRTVYWIVTEEVANRKYASLLKLQRLQGCVDVQNLHVGGNASNDSPDIFNQLLAALNEVVEK